MSLVLRAAIVARLNDAASIFDSLIARASSCEPAGQPEIYEQQHATELAGIAAWEAVDSGLFNVPSIARLVGKLRAGGLQRPSIGQDSGQLFLDVMNQFCCSVGDNLFPYYEHIQEAQKAHAASKTHPLCIQQRQHELREYATSCRMLAKLIEAGDDSAHRPDGEKARALLALADEARAYRDYILDNARTGGDSEYELFQLIYELRCYYAGDVPDTLKPAWEQFQIGTAPYDESIPVTLNALREMQSWAENERESTPDTKPDTPTIVLSPFQQAILAALDGHALKKQPLANEVCAREGTRLYKPNGIKELIEAGLVTHKNGIGYYRPDAPPPGLIVPARN